LRVALSRFSFLTTAPPQSYTLSLHDALPISSHRFLCCTRRPPVSAVRAGHLAGSQHQDMEGLGPHANMSAATVVPVEQRVKTKRSEEHTSELQSRFDLVCRLLLEKKKKQQTD